MQTRNIDAIEWSKSAEGKIVSPPFIGDSEIRLISMNLSECVVSLFTYGELENSPESVNFQYQLVIRGTKYFAFSSDHLQNVVDAIYIYSHDEIEKARSFKDFSGRRYFPESVDLVGNYYIFIVPITGGELFAIADELEFQLHGV